MSIMKVAKLDAICAQLDAAIELFFLSVNFIATHKLAAAAYNALKDIAKKQKQEHPFLKRGYLETLPEVERKRIMGFLNGVLPRQTEFASQALRHLSPLGRRYKKGSRAG